MPPTPINDKGLGFFLKIGILNPKVYINNLPNIEVCNFILAPSTQNSVFQATDCSALLKAISYKSELANP